MPHTQRQFSNGTWLQSSGTLPDETLVSLTVNGIDWLTFSCTPSHLEALAVGFLFNEQVISSAQEIENLRVCPGGDNIDVWLTHAAGKPENWQRTSGCTGGVTQLGAQTPPIIDQPGLFAPTEIIHSMELLAHSQEMYRETGGLHCSALSDGCTILISAEDIGRHNTLDKIAGMMLAGGIFPDRRMLLTTGRISSEMLQKSARMGASMVVSRTAPTSRSVALANQSGICLVGYARGDHFTVYTHAEQIISDDQFQDDANVNTRVQSAWQDPRLR